MAFFQTETLWVNQFPGGIAALVLDVPDRKVNVLNRQVLGDLDQALNKVAAGNFQGLLIRSGKTENFCAGADLHECGADADNLVALAESGQRLFNKLASLPIPSVAVIAGTCLGGGLELALACDCRVVVDKPTTQLGFPEVELGLVPAWGGTQRLPRVVGLERALQMIVGARRLGASDALAWGLADELLPDSGDDLPEIVTRVHKRPRTGLPYRTWRQRLFESTRLGRWLIFRGTRHLLERRVPDDMPAPGEAVEAIRAGLRHGFDAGLAYERQALGRLVQTPACRHLIQLFFQREEARKAPEKKREGARLLRRLGVVGAGTMGLAIAHLAASRGFEVVIREANEMALGLTVLRLHGLFKQGVDKGLLSLPEAEKKLSAIHGTTAWKGFDQVDAVIEAVEEDRAKKRQLFQEMERHVPESAILTSITTSLSIADLQKDLKNPGRMAGLHFFHPVARVPLVEVVRGRATGPGVAEDLADWVRKLGRIGLMVRDSPGFVVHRVCMPAWNEAILLLAEGHRLDRIDAAMTRFGMPQGPFEYVDHLGLDEAAALVQTLEPLFGQRLPLSPLFALMVEKGWLGSKTGLGFYRYKGQGKKSNPGLRDILAALPEPDPVETLSAADQMKHIQERLVGLLVNETARCCEEELADETTIDLALVLAGAWAPHRGGPLAYARERGQEMVASLTTLAQRLGSRFEPCAKLRQLAKP